MQPYLRILAACAVATALSAAGGAQAQRFGGVLRVHLLDSPPSLSMHEEVDANPARAAMGIFNNLIMFDQHAKQNNMQSIIPDLATAWSWSEDGKELTLPLRQGVKWHDGRPFSAKDVKCTWDLLTGQSSEKLRLNPRKSWYRNLQEVTTNGDYEVTFHLQRPQPAFIALLAAGFSVVYPCHAGPNEMRQHPIGTGPFKFVEFKPNERITVTRNRITGSRAGPILTVSSFRSSAKCRRPILPLLPAVSIGSLPRSRCSRTSGAKPPKQSAR
jgi:peptide/nickel transport system substrate-binding protein